MTDSLTRRGAINAALGAAAAGATLSALPGRAQGAATRPIVLYCDLVVDPMREAEMLKAYHERFKPAGAKFEGFIDLKMLKLRTIIQGYKLPAGVTYRFQLTYQNEELRQRWIASKVHAELWPLIENCLLDKNFHVSLFDEV